MQYLTTDRRRRRQDVVFTMMALDVFRLSRQTARFVVHYIDFKLAVLVHKALHGQLPQYLAEDCQLLTDIGCRSLRSGDVLTCATIRTRTRLGDSFSVAGPCLWNSLSVTLRDRDISLAQFKRHLKTLWFV